MTTAAQATSVDRSSVATIVGGGIKLGLLTAVGVAAFALLARALAGTAEVIVCSVLVFVGGILVSYLPSVWVRPRSADGIAWAALIGVLGATGFAVIDVALLRPMSLYHWTWDAIGGGSGFWYIPVWWMGAATLAWLGGMVVGYGAQGGRDPVPLLTGTVTAALGVILFAILGATALAPFHPAVAALAFTIALVLHVPLAAVMHRR